MHRSSSIFVRLVQLQLDSSLAPLYLYSPSVSHYANYTPSPSDVRQLDRAASVAL
jgi:hypothetical protein